MPKRCGNCPACAYVADAIKFHWERADIIALKNNPCLVTGARARD